MLEEEMQPMMSNICQRLMRPMVISTDQPDIEPVAEDVFCRVVKEEMQAAEEKLLTRGRQHQVVKERSLRLKLDEVSGSVQTGMELKGINDGPLQVVLLDDDHIVTSGPESSAKVEIVLLDASGDDENNLTHENFDSKIIGEEDKEKPHFAKNVYTCLNKGVGLLIGLKLGHGKDWIKFCNCRLGARIVQNIRGVIVQEAWTSPFKVIDKRCIQYGKHDPPFLLSDVWRLKRIARDGEPCKRLKKKNIKTVQDFRFWLSVDPEGLQQILRAGDVTWQTTVTHARTCIIEDDKKMYSYKSLTEPLVSVVYNIVGEMKAVINNGHFVPIDNLSSDKKDDARELLKEVLENTAFEERYKTVFNNEASLMKEIPYGSSSNINNASTNSSMQQYVNSSDLILSENIGVYQTTELGSSSQIINPSYFCDAGPSESLGSKDMGEIHDWASGHLFPDPKNINGGTPTELACSDYEPSLSGEVCQLVNIYKDGEIHKRLLDNKINTLEGFLIHLMTDSEGLREIVNLEPQEWEATMSNARAILEQKKGNFIGDALALSYPTSMLLEKEKAGDGDGDGDEVLEEGISKNWCNVMIPLNDMVGESSSRLSNTSFQSVGSTMEYSWMMDMLPSPSSPNPMMLHYDDTYSYNTHHMYEGSGAEPEVIETTTNPPNGLKRLSRLFSSIKEKMLLDHKKPKVG